ncbi:MAG TPA: EFR1 family ferrodoxin [Smithella sp.]|nr:EFR1 family ferrodoxin [Smithella sp.]
METRRDFIKKTAVAGAALCLPVAWGRQSAAAYPDFKTRDPKKILILWYSQTGHTQRYARLIGCVLKAKNLAVDVRELQETDPKILPLYDLIFIGSPVFYYDAPSNVVEWLEKIPAVTGTPAAAFVSFGGPEGNQRNASCHLLKILVDKGALPVARDSFRNIPTYPTPNWASANQKSGEHLPNAATYDQVRRFASSTLERIFRGETISIEYEFALREPLRHLPLVWMNKRMITRHTVDASACIGCGTCVRKCPTKAIDPFKQSVDRERCLACFGCLNNCPEGAVVMEYGGKRLFGFFEYLKRRNITILEPEEFKKCT